MREAATIDVTYTGNDDPFIDRIYGTRLTFEKGQTRALKPELAARFLQHADVFKGPETAATTEDQAKSEDGSNTGQGDANANSTETNQNPDGKPTDGTTGDQKPADQTGDRKQEQVDDTAAQLAEAEKKAAEQRRQEEARFQLHQSLDTMTKAALRDFVKVNYKQDLPDGKVADMRQHAKSLVDQFGAP